MTPYEEYLRKGIDQEKKNLDTLYNDFAHARSLNKQLLKRKIDETLQNIELLSQELEKYRKGLSWLREPSKERDAKAEQLEKIQEEPQSKPAAQVAKPSVPTSRPSVGTPIGTPRPTIGKPQPTVGTPVAKPKKEESAEENKQT
jgi:hypothetical protein